MTLRNYKFAVFSALVLSMIIPFAGISMANASQTAEDKYGIGKVADGTYNETAALQRATELMNMSDENSIKKQELEKKLATTTLSTEIEAIKAQINEIQGQIDQNTQEFNAIQEENWKLYYVEPVLLEKYQSASDEFMSTTLNQYWKGKSFEESKNIFPLVEIGVNGKQKAVEITLWKGIENSPKVNQYITMIKELMPKDIPWFVSFDEYPSPVTCTSRTSACVPRIGGIEIGITISPNNFKICTLGFKATRNSDGAPGFVTAGHCEDGLTGHSVLQPHTGSSIGTASTEVYSNGSDCDCGWVKLNSGVSISDAIFNTGSSTYTPTSLTAQSGQTAGTLIKQSGLASGIQTGSVTMNDVSITNTDGITILHVVKDSMTVRCTDSGAPVTNSAGTSLFGLVVAGNVGTTCNVGTITYHSPENRAAADLGVTIAVG